MRHWAPESLLLLLLLVIGSEEIALVVGDVGVLVVDMIVSVADETVSVGGTRNARAKQDSRKSGLRPSSSSRLIWGCGVDVTADKKAGVENDKRSMNQQQGGGINQ